MPYGRNIPLCGSSVMESPRSIRGRVRPAIGQLEEASVRRVDVHPELLGLRDLRNVVQWIDRAGVRRTGGGHHQERPEARLSIRAVIARSASGSIRSSASVGTRRRFRSEKPAIVAALDTDACA